jgi:hypothetical protein
LPDFPWYKIPKREKIYHELFQIPIKYNGKKKKDRKIDQVSIKYTSKFTQIWIFGLKTNHLATLVWNHFDRKKRRRSSQMDKLGSIVDVPFLPGFELAVSA